MTTKNVRVRFAPSPTGYLHIGGARTALYSYLYAKATGGKLILRIEDTDLERSERKYEESQIDDLKWCGIDYDEGPDKPGDFGPYRQSERNELYKKHSQELVDKGIAYPCFCSQERLEKLKEELEAKEQAPHYDRVCLKLSKEEVSKKIEAKEEHVIRFKVPEKTYSFKDHVRGEVSWPNDMVGDFVIMRSNGIPTYNFCCVVDDWLMEISHVIRAEEHLNNTLRQLMIYEALSAAPPEFVHCSLLVGEDRQKLSKRHGATSVSQYRDQEYLPEALMNYLLLLGWSHPEEKDVFNIQELGNIFDLKRFSKSPALYDMNKLNFFNGQYLRNLPNEEIVRHFNKVIPSDHPFNKQDEAWKNSFAELLKEKIQTFPEILEKLSLVFSSELENSEEMTEIKGWETTTTICQYLQDSLKDEADDSYIDEEKINGWMTHLKKELKIKGKPLFKGLRAVLTGRADGPDLKKLVSLTPVSFLKSRVSSF